MCLQIIDFSVYDFFMYLEILNLSAVLQLRMTSTRSKAILFG